jgi:hypothetical protein
MTDAVDKFWKKLEKDLAKKSGFAPLTPAEAEMEFEELPDTKLPDSEIESIMEEVISGQLTDWTPTPIDEQNLGIDAEVIEEDVYQLNRNAGEGDVETDGLLDELRRKALEDKPEDGQENETRIDGDADSAGEGN